MGYQIKSTNKAAITRKLNSLGFQKTTRHDSQGYLVIDLGSGEFKVLHYAKGQSKAFDELFKANFAIENVTRRFIPEDGIEFESFTIWGKKIYN